MLTPKKLLFAAALLGGSASAADFGNLVFIGDSITQGGQGFTGYRYEVWKTLVDNGATFNLVGSQSGFYQNTAAATPAYKSTSFTNVHEGHWGWRASWESGAVPLLDGRYDVNNLGNGVLSTWLGLTSSYQTAASDGVTNLQTRTYTGTTYSPDTAVILLGVNDIASSGGAARTAAQVSGDIRTMVTQLQQKNANVRVYVGSILPSANTNATQNQTIADTNAALAADVAGWSTGSSSVSYVNLRNGFTAASNGLANTQTDGTHPNYSGQRVVANNLTAAMGLAGRDNTAGQTTRATANLGASTGQRNDFNALPGTATGVPLYRAGTTSAWTTPTAGTLSFSTTTAASLKSDWAVSSNQTYTIEAALKVTAGGNQGFVFWSDDGAAGAAAGFLRVYHDRTMWGYTGSLTVGSGYFVLDSNLNSDALHVFRLSYDGATYAVWRDGVLIADGLSGSTAASAQNALVLGAFTTDTVVAEVDYVHVDTGGAFASVTAIPEPSTYGLFGAAALAGLALVRRRRR